MTWQQTSLRWKESLIYTFIFTTCSGPRPSRVQKTRIVTWCLPLSLSLPMSFTISTIPPPLCLSHTLTMSHPLSLLLHFFHMSRNCFEIDPFFLVSWYFSITVTTRHDRPHHVSWTSRRTLSWSLQQVTWRCSLSTSDKTVNMSLGSVYRPGALLESLVDETVCDLYVCVIHLWVYTKEREDKTLRIEPSPQSDTTFGYIVLSIFGFLLPRKKT
jgi:hypothetical protein